MAKGLGFQDSGIAQIGNYGALSGREAAGGKDQSLQVAEVAPPPLRGSSKKQSQPTGLISWDRREENWDGNWWKQGSKKQPVPLSLCHLA